jgi:hypothetical protein
LPHLLVYQSLWAMEGLPGVDLDDGLQQVVERILDAGFDGVGVNLARRPRAKVAAGILADRGGSWEAQAFVRNAGDLSHYLDEVLAIGGAHHLNVQIAGPAAGAAEALALMEQLLAAVRGSPLPVLFETHRGRLTNDLFLTTALLDAFADLTLTADLSHYVTAHEMALPLEPRLAMAMNQVLARSGAFHLRIAGPGQVQTAVDAPYAAAWAGQFQAWWRQGMRGWLAGAGEHQSLAVLCELGPSPYAIVGPDGCELTDRWDEALRLKAMADAAFDAVRQNEAAGAAS